MSEIIRNDAGNPLYPVSPQNVVDEDSSFQVGDSPHVIDVNAAIGRNGNAGYIKVDGTGDLLVKFSHRGTSYLDQFTLKNGDSLDLRGLDLDTIVLTHSGADTAYRVLVF